MTNNFSNTLLKIKSHFSSDLDEMNKIIENKIQNNVGLLFDIASHVLSTKGKKVRPLITLLSSNFFGYQSDNKDILLASCVEFIHTATLLHDDVVDISDSRRGVMTTNSIWNNKASVLFGDYLFTKSFELMVEVKSLDILKVLSEASSIIAQGELMQLEETNNTDITFYNYEKIIFAKTASLFSASAQVGAILSNTSQENIKNITEYGVNLGLVFQMMDDLLDYIESKESTGKPIGNDFKEGKVTLPILLLLQECNKEEKDFIIRIFKNLDQQENDLAKLQSMIAKYNITYKSFKIIESYIEKGLKNLENIQIENIYKNLLKDLLQYSIKRNN